MEWGRTAHTTLQLPLDLSRWEFPICNIKKNTGKANLLKECKILFWDEISMMHKNGVEALDRTLKDIRENNQIMGGLVVVLANARWSQTNITYY